MKVWSDTRAAGLVRLANQGIWKHLKCVELKNLCCQGLSELKVELRKAEELNRRLLVAARADRSGWDLTQLLRPPGARNRKYQAAPRVRLVEMEHGLSYHPCELELALPHVDAAPVMPTVGALPKCPPSPTDLCRLSRRARALIRLGNAGAGSPYPSRSEADFAVCLAMFGAGYEEGDIWAVMTDPANGISERALEKGRHAEGYLALTIGKAKSIARDRPM